MELKESIFVWKARGVEGRPTPKTELLSLCVSSSFLVWETVRKEMFLWKNGNEMVAKMRCTNW